MLAFERTLKSISFRIVSYRNRRYLPTDLAKISNSCLEPLTSTKLELLLLNFQVCQYFKVSTRRNVYISSARRPAALGTRYTYRLNRKNNGRIRNVPRYLVETDKWWPIRVQPADYKRPLRAATHDVVHVGRPPPEHLENTVAEKGCETFRTFPSDARKDDSYIVRGRVAAQGRTCFCGSVAEVERELIGRERPEFPSWILPVISY